MRWKDTCHRVLVLILVLAPVCATHSAAADGSLELWGIEARVGEIDEGIAFYRDVCGFTEQRQSDDAAILVNGGVRLLLTRSDAAPGEAHLSHANLNMSVADLDAATDIARTAGATVLDDEPQRAVIGNFRRVVDPWGNAIHLIDVDDDELATNAPPRVYNLGAQVHDMAAAEAFLTGVGLEVLTRDYLPQTLVFKPVGAAMVVLHPGASGPADSSQRQMGLVFTSDDPTGRVDHALDGGAMQIARTRHTLLGVTTSGLDASGCPFRIVSGDEFAESSSDVTPAIEGRAAAHAFERFKQLAGAWRGSSTKQWESLETYELIANESVVLATWTNIADRSQKMVTAYHMDGDRLMATHYCGAGNQPRLVLTEIADGGDTITLAFLDGTGMTSRDDGHMDKAVFRFVNDDHFTSQWTFYRDGQESWMEAITYERAADGERASD